MSDLGIDYVSRILHAMCLEGWADEEIGDTQDSFYVWRLSTDRSPDDTEIRQILDRMGIPPTAEFIAQLRGHFIVSVSKRGLVIVTRQPSYEQSKARFEEIEMIYLNWLRESGGALGSKERLNSIGAMSEESYRRYRESFRALSAISCVIAFEVSSGIQPSEEIIASWKEADRAHQELCSQLVAG